VSITCGRQSINLVCGLALTVKPTCKSRGLAFPLFKDQAEWAKEADKPLKGIPLGAKEAIRQLQPWADPDGFR